MPTSEKIKSVYLFNLEHTLAKELITKYNFPFEVLPHIKQFILELGKSLSQDLYDNPKEDIWIAKSAKVANSASISGPCIIDESAEIRHCAFIRGSVIIGKGAVVGNSTELKNSILFDEVQVPHFNYVGDSLLGYRSHLGAGSITSNVKSDKTPVSIKIGDEKIQTGMKKFGAILGDFVEVGCNTVLCPGTIIGKNTNIYPSSCVRGFVSEKRIYKNDNTVVEKE